MNLETMENIQKLLESLLESATEYGKTSIELVKLKILDKTSDVVSSIVSHSIVLVLIMFFLLFCNLGLALWLGEILGKLYYGFLIVGAFYVLIAIVVHFFAHKPLKKCIGNYIIKQVLK